MKKEIITRTVTVYVFGGYDCSKSMKRVCEKTSINPSIPAEGDIIYALENIQEMIASVPLDKFMEIATLKEGRKKSGE